MCPGPGLSGRGEQEEDTAGARGTAFMIFLASSPDWAEDADWTSSSDTGFPCLYLKEMYLPRGLLSLYHPGPVLKTQGEDGPPREKGRSSSRPPQPRPLPGSARGSDVQCATSRNLG